MGSQNQAITGKTYLDEQGNPITQGKVYLDEKGNPTNQELLASAPEPAKPKSTWETLTDVMPSLRTMWTGATTPLLPLREMVEPITRTAQKGVPFRIPTIPGGPVFNIDQETAAGIVEGAATSVQELTKPTTAAMIGGLGLLTTAGFPGFVVATGISGDMARQAYKQYKAAVQAEEAGQEREVVAGKTGAAISGLMAIMPFLHLAGRPKPAMEMLRQGMESPYLDAESLARIRERIPKLNIPEQDKTYLIALADQRAARMPPGAPPVANIGVPRPEAAGPGTLAVGPFPGPAETIRAQMNAPRQPSMMETTGAPLPPGIQGKAAMPAIPLPRPLPSPSPELPPPFEEIVRPPAPVALPPVPTLPGIPVKKPAFNPYGALSDMQRKAIFAIAGHKGIKSDVVQGLAGKRISELNAGEGQDLIVKLNRITPEEIKAATPPATIPLLDQVLQATEVRPEARPPVQVPPPVAPPIIPKTLGKARKYDPEKSLTNAILHLGGINPNKIKGAGTWEEWKALPPGVKVNVFRAGSRSAPDDMASQLAGLGYGDITSENDLLAALQTHPKRGLTAIAEESEVAQLRAHVESLEKQLAQREEVPFKPEEFLTKGEEKPIIREPGEEGFAKFRDERTKEMFEPVDFLLRGGVMPKREEVSRVRPAMKPEPRAQQLGMLQGPLFERRLETRKEPPKNPLLEIIEPKKSLDQILPEKGNWMSIKDLREKIQISDAQLLELARRGDVVLGRWDGQRPVSGPDFVFSRTSDEIYFAVAKPRSEDIAAPLRAAPERPRPVEELAGEWAQTEVDRRAQVVRETIDRVMKGKGSWADKRKQLGLGAERYGGEAFYPDIPISRPEIERIVNREMADTVRETGIEPTKPQTPAIAGKAKPRGLFGEDEGFARFRGRGFIDDDPQLKEIFERLEEAERNAKRSPLSNLPKRGQADVPGESATAVGHIRSLPKFLLSDEKSAPIARVILNAAADRKMEMQKYYNLGTSILKGIKPKSEEAYGVFDLLDRKMTAQELIGSPTFKGDPHKAIDAAQRLRNEIFEPIIKALQTPEMVKEIGKTGYVRGYAPHIIRAFRQALGKEGESVFWDMLPKSFKSRFLKKRDWKMFDYDRNIFAVLPQYINSTMKTLHDIPAYSKALETIEKLPEGNFRNLAQWYADNYIGQPKLKGPLPASELIQKVSNRIGQTYYDAYIGANPRMALVNLTQTLTNTYPELGAKYTTIGLKKLLTDPLARKDFHDSGLLFDYPGLENEFSRVKGFRKSFYWMFQRAEYVNRGIAYLGGQAKANDMGLVGKAAQRYGFDVVRETNFIYGKEDPIAFLSMLPTATRTFKTFAFKEADFVGTIFRRALKKGASTEDRAKLGRFLMVVVGGPLAAATAGVDRKLIQKYGLDPMDMIPRLAPVTSDIAAFSKYVYDVQAGRRQIHDIPRDACVTILGRIPGGLALTQGLKDVGIIKTKKPKK